MGLGWGPAWGVQHRRGIQYCPARATTDPDTAESSDLDPIVARSLLALTPIIFAMAGIQAGLIVGLGILKDRGVEWPMTSMAVLSAVLLAAGVLRHYWDIWVHRTVRGISFTFVGIDALGDVFSLVSVMFQRELNILGMVIYGTELLLWIGVFACGGYYNFMPWMLRARQGGEVETEEPMRENEAGDSERDDGVALHEMPSSTSVFHTASREQDLRQRTGTQVGTDA
ncbi:PQ loop repeat protein [Sarocladium implicatum]|nr:PQ loop repeat protein [Sarocladium implicatum]